MSQHVAMNELLDWLEYQILQVVYSIRSDEKAEKTDLLTEDLQNVDKSVEKIKLACITTSKKLSACMQTRETDNDKRKKKLNQHSLGHDMMEYGSVLGEGSMFGNVLLGAGDAESRIANELATCEGEIEDKVLGPLNKIVENDIPSIVNLKKKLSKVRLDMDSCKTRWNNAAKLAQNTSTSNRQDAQAKANALQAEYEDNCLLFQQIQDSLATEMLTFLAGEKSYAQYLIDLMESQMRYHKAAFEILEKVLPNVRQQVENSLFRPVFGCSLSDHLHVTRREIAVVLEECVLFILEHAMDAEGLFRLAGSSTKIKKLKAAFDAGLVEIEDYINEIHVVTGVLKQYLRELPEPILTSSMYDEWIAASKVKDRDQRLQVLWSLVDQLPRENKVNLRYLMCFLTKLAENSDANKMTPNNIAIVIGPNLLWKDGAVNIADTGNISTIVESFIEHCTWFFPDGCEFKRHQLSQEHIEMISNRFTQKEIGGESPEPPSSASGPHSLFSEVSKKFGRNKDGNTDAASNHNTSTTSVNTQNNQPSNANTGLGYYNPLATQYDAELEACYENPPVPPKKPSTPPNNSASTEGEALTNDRTMSTSSLGSDEGTPTANPPGHRRTPSGNAPKRPAPPIPKGKKPYIPENPPKPKLSELARNASSSDVFEKPD